MKTKTVVIASVLAVSAVWLAADYRNTPDRSSDLRDAVSDSPNGALDLLKSTGGDPGTETALPVPAAPVSVGDKAVPLADLKPGDKLLISKKLSKRIAKAVDTTGVLAYANGKEVRGVFSALYAAGHVIAGESALRYAQINLYWPKLGDKCAPPEPGDNIVSVTEVHLSPQNEKNTVKVEIEFGGEGCIQKITVIKTPSDPRGATAADLEAAFGGQMVVDRTVD